MVAIKRAVDSAGPYLYRKKMKKKKKERRWMGLGREREGERYIGEENVWGE